MMAVSESSGSRAPTPILNPLVMAGLVPSNLSDILAVNGPDVQPKRRVVKARWLLRMSIIDKD